VQAVLEMPDNTIPQLKAKRGEDGEEQYIKRDNAALIHIVSDLPTQAASFVQNAHALFDHSPLLFNVILDLKAFLVGLAQIVGR
jgi:hypothetical protein